MAPHRRNIGASRRRRREDDGEDGDSADGELDDESLSEGSDISHQEDDDADGESSDGGEQGKVSTSAPQAARVNGHQVNGRVPALDQPSERRTAASPEKQGKVSTVSDTEAMLNGLKVSEDTDEVAETHFDDMKEEPGQQQEGRASELPTDPRRDTFGEKKRREQERYLKERDKNPAFVPTRGSFFLHDKRSTELGSTGSSNRSFNKSKSRPYGLIVDGNAQRYGCVRRREGNSGNHLGRATDRLYTQESTQIRCQSRAVDSRSPRYCCWRRSAASIETPFYCT